MSTEVLAQESITEDNFLDLQGDIFDSDDPNSTLIKLIGVFHKLTEKNDIKALIDGEDHARYIFDFKYFDAQLCIDVITPIPNNLQINPKNTKGMIRWKDNKADIKPLENELDYPKYLGLMQRVISKDTKSYIPLND